MARPAQPASALSCARENFRSRTQGRGSHRIRTHPALPLMTDAWSHTRHTGISAQHASHLDIRSGYVGRLPTVLIDWNMIHTVPSCIAGDVDPHGGAGCRGLGVSQPAVTEAGEECVRAAAEGVRAAR